MITVSVSRDGKVYSVVEDCDIEPTTFFEGTLDATKKFIEKVIASGELLEPDNY